MPRLVLYQPDIPQNTGALIRLGACLGTGLDIIEPCGFVLDDARLRRAHMDYLALVDLSRFADWAAYRQARPGRQVLLAPQGTGLLYDFTFAEDDCLILGPESQSTLPFLVEQADAVLRIPMQAGARSLNVAMAGAIALGEVRRQWPI